MKRINLLRCLCLAVILACSNCVWAYNFEVDGIYYEIVDENTVYVVNGYDSYYGDIVIPSTVTLDSVTYDVQGVMHGAFDYSGITSLTIPSTLYIYYPITGCYALESIVVDGNDGYYDSRDNCNAIIETSTNRLVLGCRNTVIPSTVEVIGYAAFAGCYFSSFTIPANVTRIEDEAFKECYALTDLYIEDGDKPLAVGYGGTSGYDQKISIFYDSPLTTVYLGRDIEMIDPYLLNNISGVFAEKQTLSSVTIGERVTEIQDNTFNSCRGLNSIDIPGSVVRIGHSAFEGSGLTGELVIPPGVKEIGDNAFLYCSGLTGELVIPEGVVSIGMQAFSSNEMLKGLKLPKSLKVLGDRAFSYCRGLDNVVIPNGITYIGYDMFNECISLKNVVIPESVVEIRGGAFAHCTALEEITIPNSVTNLEHAFWGCTALKKITLPGSLVTIGDYAFRYCHSLESITIPNSVMQIGESAFEECALKSVVIPNSVTRIGRYAFNGCASLSQISFPEGLEYVGGGAFHNTAWYKSWGVELVYIGNLLYECKIGDNASGLIEIREGTTAICEGAFISCNVKNIKIPNSVEYIGSHAFDGSKWYKSWYESQPDGPIYIGKVLYDYKGDVPDNLVVKDGTTGITALPYKIQSITIPSSVKYLGNGFVDDFRCVYITDMSAWCSVEIYKDVFEDHKFDIYLNGELVTELVVPEDVTEIKNYAFEGCGSLKSVIMGDNVVRIGLGAFEGCHALEDIYLTGVIPAKVASSAFTSEHYEKVILHVPETAIDAYRTADVWKEFKNIQAYETAGIDDCEMNTVACEYVGGGVRFVGVHNGPLSVYNTDGVLVSHFITYSGETIALEKGIYIICVGDANTKIVLK